MSNNITAISFDKRTFRFSPFTQHEDVSFGEGATVMLYDDSLAPERGSNVLKLPEKFRAAAQNTDKISILYVALSGLRADPNIDFTVEGQKVSVRAADYLKGYGYFLKNAPNRRAHEVRKRPLCIGQLRQKMECCIF